MEGRAWRQLRRNKAAIIGGAYLILLAFAIIVGPWLWRWNGTDFDLEYLDLHTTEYQEREDAARQMRRELRRDGLRDEELANAVRDRIDLELGEVKHPLPAPPSLRHPFGTDLLGRDVLARTLLGGRITLTVGLMASLIAVVIGVAYGSIAGYLGGYPGRLMMRGVDILYGIPFLLFVIIFVIIFEGDYTGAGRRAIFGENGRLFIILLALGLTYWLPMARIVRAQLLSLKEREFVLSARALGAPGLRILTRHLIPNTLGAILVVLTLSIPQAIFAEAFLAYIGMGIDAPMASWGTLANEGTQYIRESPHLLFIPAMAISMTMLAFNFLGDGLRDAVDPRLEARGK